MDHLIYIYWKSGQRRNYTVVGNELMSQLDIFLNLPLASYENFSMEIHYWEAEKINFPKDTRSFLKFCYFKIWDVQQFFVCDFQYLLKFFKTLCQTQLNVHAYSSHLSRKKFNMASNIVFSWLHLLKISPHRVKKFPISHES